MKQTEYDEIILGYKIEGEHPFHGDYHRECFKKKFGNRKFGKIEDITMKDSDDFDGIIFCDCCGTNISCTI